MLVIERVELSKIEGQSKLNKHEWNYPERYFIFLFLSFSHQGGQHFWKLPETPGTSPKMDFNPGKCNKMEKLLKTSGIIFIFLLFSLKIGKLIQNS